MNHPATPAERRAFADALADIRFHQQRTATATKALLTSNGWRYTCLNPAHLWLWSKQLPGGRTILTDPNTALAIQASLAGQPLPPPASAPAWHLRTDPNHPAFPQPPVPSADNSPP